MATTGKTHSDFVFAEPLRVLQAFESEQLGGVDALELRYTILEATACLAAKIELVEYRETFRLGDVSDAADISEAARELLRAIRSTGLSTPVGLAALGETLKDGRQRQTLGSHFTDFRLAEELARPVVDAFRPGMTVVDPAAGAGILLASVLAGIKASHPSWVRGFLRESSFAADIQGDAIRALRLALASAATELADVVGLQRNLAVGDSLTSTPAAWSSSMPGGFDFVVANPPWEKVKATRHEIMKATVPSHVYGSDVVASKGLSVSIAAEQHEIREYSKALTSGRAMQGDGDADLYRLFVEWSTTHLSRPGVISILVPAGLIRSKSDARLRAFLLENTRSLELNLFDNKARFFAIDSRFKFVHLVAELGRPPMPQLTLRHSSADSEAVTIKSSVTIPRDLIVSLNREMTIPEVRTDSELKLLRHMHLNGEPFGDPEGAWRPHVVREVDMTRHRPMFSNAPSPTSVAVIEGRMVHQFRTAAKQYVSGSGRSAKWTSSPSSSVEVRPQFWTELDSLRSSISARTQNVRAGFCDITGQTNERTLLAAALPPGVVSGNKVPTIQFHAAGDSEDLVYLWTAVANSFAVDWLLRRSITTTLNFFILNALHLPDVALGTTAGERLAILGRELADTSETMLSEHERTTRRVEADMLIFEAFNLQLADAELVMRDFPLLDRSQRPLPGERRSTITRDVLLANYAERRGEKSQFWLNRVEAASLEGATNAYRVGSTK